MTSTDSIIGVVADTHGLIRPAALDALSGADHIVHAGDVGCCDVLEALARIAPVTAVRGNNDSGVWAETLPRSEIAEIGGIRLFVVHCLSELEIDTSANRLDAVVSGHTHNPSIETRDGILYLDPGSAGPHRFNYPVTLARLHVGPRGITPEIVHLEP